MSDLISKKNTIKALKSFLVDPEKAVSEHPTDVEKYNSGILMAIQVVSDMLPATERIQAIKDCRNCKEGKYNDHYGIHFCYCSDDCVNFNLWEAKEYGEVDELYKK